MVVMTGILLFVAMIMGVVGLAVYYPWTGFISGGLAFVGMSYFIGHNDEI